MPGDRQPLLPRAEGEVGRKIVFLEAERERTDGILNRIAEKARNSEGEAREQLMVELKRLAGKLQDLEMRMREERLKHLEREMDQLRQEIRNLGENKERMTEELLKQRLEGPPAPRQDDGRQPRLRIRTEDGPERRRRPVEDESNLRGRGPDVEPAKTDAVIRKVDQVQEVVYLNVGSKDLVAPGLSLGVYGLDRDGKPKKLPKGSVEVTKVIDAGQCEARITRQEHLDPIQPGDVVASAL